MVAGNAYAVFQERYQRAVKIAQVIDEAKAEEKKLNQAKRKFGLGGSSS